MNFIILEFLEKCEDEQEYTKNQQELP